MRKFVLVLALAAIGLAAFAQGWAPREPIYIHGNEAFTWANGVVRGSGTEADPYIIEGWVIETAGYDYGIYISETTAHFVIRNCEIRYPQERAGIFLSAVRNGRIEKSSVFGGKIAIHLLSAKNTVITGNAIGYCDYGIRVSTGSDDNLIYGNSIINCGLPAQDDGLRNQWYYQGQGNYWSDYRGEDRTGDGIGDTIYEVVPDRFPLMSPPVRLPDEAAPMRTLDLTTVTERGIVTLAPGSLVRLVARDVGVGVDKIHYRLDGGEWKVYERPFALEGRAQMRLEYYAVDKLGNREPTRALTVYLDMEPPVTRIVAGDPHYQAPDKLWATSRTPFTLKSEDDSGVANIFYRINEREWKRYTEPFTIPGPEGPHKVEYYAIDVFGNREAVQSAVIWKDDTAPVTEATKEDGESPFDRAAPDEETEEEPVVPPVEDGVGEEPDPEPPAPADISFRITLTDARLVDDDGVVDRWALSFVWNGEETLFQTTSLPVPIYAGTDRELTLKLQAAEEGSPERSGEASLMLEPPWTAGSVQLDVPVAVAEEIHAVWQFTVDVVEEREDEE